MNLGVGHGVSQKEYAIAKKFDKNNDGVIDKSEKNAAL